MTSSGRALLHYVITFVIIPIILFVYISSVRYIRNPISLFGVPILVAILNLLSVSLLQYQSRFNKIPLTIGRIIISLFVPIFTIVIGVFLNQSRVTGPDSASLVAIVVYIGFYTFFYYHWGNILSDYASDTYSVAQAPFPGIGSIHGHSQIVRDVLNAIDSECKKMDFVGVGILQEKAREGVLKNASLVDEQFKNNPKPPEITALFLLMNIAYSQISSGQHHVYRGTLNTIGINLKKCWEYTSQRLLEMKEISLDDYSAARDDVQNAIDSVG